MKACPICKRIYDDELNFCLDDGAALAAPSGKMPITGQGERSSDQETAVLDADAFKEVTVARSAFSKEPDTIATPVPVRRRRFPIVAGLIVLLLVVSVGGYFGYTKFLQISHGGRETPEGAIWAMTAAVKARDVQGFERFLDPLQLSDLEAAAKKEGITVDAMALKEMQKRKYQVVAVSKPTYIGGIASVEVNIDGEMYPWLFGKYDGEWKCTSSSP